MDFHEVSNIFPLMNDVEYANLKDDIKNNGLIEEIWTYQGKIIDGRNRYNACIELGIDPRYREWSGEGSLVMFVVSENINRRHLDSNQRAAISVVALKLLEDEAKERREATQFKDGKPPVVEKIPLPSAGKSRDQAATLFNTNPHYVSDAKKINDESPETLELVKDATLTINEAKTIIKEPEEVQAQTIESVKDGTKFKKALSDARHEFTVQKANAIEFSSDDYKMLHGDFVSVSESIAAASIDAIITDPPYPKEFLPLYSQLATVAERVLKDGGSCFVMCAHIYLPQIFEMLSSKLDYHWTLAYLVPGANNGIFERKINTGWKPVLWYVKGKATHPTKYDVVKSDAADKDFHEWGQSVSGMVEIVDRFTNPGDLVLDPFLGGGTTGVACAMKGRRFIGIDIDGEMVQVSKMRIKEVLDGPP